ncbi:MAG: TetR/AcrR family transcriptional regulator [Pseudomonadota bacterium]
MTMKTDTRECILEAAIKRFLHYGYAKTTMSEIARDCSMSAGNIYRFFASKLDIAEAMARQYNVEFQQELAQIARDDRPAGERLYEVFDYGLKATYEKLDADAKILEVAEVLSQERPTFSNEELAQERIHLVKILKDGVAAGEFAPIDNPAFVAEMIQSAMMKFKYPQLFSRLTIEKLAREMDGVMSIILAGLRSGIHANVHASTDQ